GVEIRGEVAGEVGGGGDEGAQAALLAADASALIAEEEEELIADGRPSQAGAILIALEGIAGGREVVAGVEDCIADEAEGVAMEAVAAGAGDDVDDAAGVLSVFRAVVAGLDAELLHGVGHGEGQVDVAQEVGIGDAIEGVAGLIAVAAVDGYRDG